MDVQREELLVPEQFFPEQFWKTLQQQKHNIIYYELHAERCTRWLRALKYITAGLSAIASIVGINFIGSSCQLVAIIVTIVALLLDFLVVMIDQFPFEKRRSELRELIRELKDDYINMENDWYSIVNGKYTETEISELLSKYKRIFNNKEKPYLKDDVLPEKKRLIRKAEKITREYFENLYGVQRDET